MTASDFNRIEIDIDDIDASTGLLCSSESSREVADESSLSNQEGIKSDSGGNVSQQEPCCPVNFRAHVNGTRCASFRSHGGGQFDCFKPGSRSNSVLNPSNRQPSSSVEAFADNRRRERAGTFSTLFPLPKPGLDSGGELDVHGRAAHSDIGGTRLSGDRDGRDSILMEPRRRRPTFSEARSNEAHDDTQSHRSSAEEDVCYPQPPVTTRMCKINYDDLHEYILSTLHDHIDGACSPCCVGVNGADLESGEEKDDDGKIVKDFACETSDSVVQGDLHERVILSSNSITEFALGKASTKVVDRANEAGCGAGRDDGDGDTSQVKESGLGKNGDCICEINRLRRMKNALNTKINANRTSSVSQGDLGKGNTAAAAVTTTATATTGATAAATGAVAAVTSNAGLETGEGSGGRSEGCAGSMDGTKRYLNPQPRYTFFSSEMSETIFASSFCGLLAKEERLEELFEPAIRSGGVWWLDMLNPPDHAVMNVCKAFGIHPLTREDIATQETREKVELFPLYYFVSFRSFYCMDKHSAEYMEPVNVYAVVFREGLVTFSFSANPHARNVRTRMGRLRDYLQMSADWICYALIDDIVDTFAPPIREIELESDAIEDEVLVARAEDSRAILRRIGECRKKVMSLIRLLGGKADVIKGFAKRCNERYEVTPHGDVGLYLSDIQDHVVTMMSNLAHFEKMLGRSHSNYLAQISVDNLRQGNTVNETLGKVTLIATILVPLNLVTGLFGMNVEVPGMHTPSLAWFFSIVGFLALVVCLALLWAKRMRMI